LLQNQFAEMSGERFRSLSTGGRRAGLRTPKAYFSTEKVQSKFAPSVFLQQLPTNLYKNP